MSLFDEVSSRDSQRAAGLASRPKIGQVASIQSTQLNSSAPRRRAALALAPDSASSMLTVRPATTGRAAARRLMQPLSRAAGPCAPLGGRPASRPAARPSPSAPASIHSAPLPCTPGPATPLAACAVTAQAAAALAHDSATADKTRRGYNGRQEGVGRARPSVWSRIL